MLSIHTDSLHKIAYSTDASIYREVPRGVAYPENTQDIVELVSEARKSSTYLIPRAAGHHEPGKWEYAKVKQNWIWLVEQHTLNANFMCTGVNEMLEDKDFVAQSRIFAVRCGKYLCDGEKIAVLNGFPLFLLEYYKELK
ncbi:MAG: FAD-binding oxidoreductase [Bacteroidales bacterium]|nr:FAD-binding oxidoreductase [Bacteroidales bacterium]